MLRDKCPKCASKRYKKNGHTHYGKQNYRCLDCGRQFVRECYKKYINDDEQQLVERLLLERLSLRGICRGLGISLTWLLSFLAVLYKNLPDDLNVSVKGHGNLRSYHCEMDEIERFNCTLR